MEGKDQSLWLVDLENDTFKEIKNGEKLRLDRFRKKPGYENYTLCFRPETNTTYKELALEINDEQEWIMLADTDTGKQIFTIESTTQLRLVIKRFVNELDIWPTIPFYKKSALSKSPD